jgi:hypothetical protein
MKFRHQNRYGRVIIDQRFTKMQKTLNDANIPRSIVSMIDYMVEYSLELLKMFWNPINVMEPYKSFRSPTNDGEHYFLLNLTNYMKQNICIRTFQKFKTLIFVLCSQIIDLSLPIVILKFQFILFNRSSRLLRLQVHTIRSSQ